MVEKSTEIYHKLNKALHSVLEEYGVSGMDLNREYKNWTGEYFEDPLSRWSRIIAQCLEEKK